jgi:hypothetical protein
MSEIIYSINTKNRNEAYIHKPEQVKIDDINTKTAYFMQELVTAKGSLLFDKQYGTTFLDDIGTQVNIYKVRYLLEKNYLPTKAKYGILSIETNKVFFSQKDGFLNIELALVFDGFKSNTGTAFAYNGSFTTKTIIEVE